MAGALSSSFPDPSAVQSQPSMSYVGPQPVQNDGLMYPGMPGYNPLAGALSVLQNLPMGGHRSP